MHKPLSIITVLFALISLGKVWGNQEGMIPDKTLLLDSTITYMQNQANEPRVKDALYKYSYDKAGNIVLEEKYDWDTSFQNWVNEHIIQSTYNEENKLLHQITKNWNPDLQSFEKVSEIQNSYDPAGRLLINESLFSGLEQKQTGVLNEFRYDENGNIISNKVLNYSNHQYTLIKHDSLKFDHSNRIILRMSFNYSLAGQIRLITKVENEYQEDGQIKSETYWRMGNLGTNELIKSRFKTFTYGSDNLLQETNLYNILNNEAEIKLVEKEIYTHNSFKLISTEKFLLNPHNNEFLPNKRSFFDYDLNGNLTNRIVQLYNKNLSKYTTIRELKNTYLNNVLIKKIFINQADTNMIIETNYNGNVQEQIITKWNYQTKSWQLVDRKITVHDDFNNVIRTEDYFWNDSFNGWVLENTRNFQFDTKYYVQDIIVNQRYKSSYDPRIRFKIDHSIDSNWVHSPFGEFLSFNSVKQTHFFSAFSGDTLEPKGEQDNFLEIYPNPFDDYIQIAIEDSENPMDIELFDLRGRKVIEVSGVIGPYILDATSLRSGAYMIRIRQNGFIYMTKLIK